MEGMTDCRRRVEALRCQVRAQVDALGILEQAFAAEGEHLRRYDQARCLDVLRARVTQEVEHLRRGEASLSGRFTRVTLISGLAKLVIGSVAAVARHTREHPLSVGVKLAASDFSQTAPFGTVMVAVGPGGIPDEALAISLSQYAREWGRSESEITAAVSKQGYRLMTPEAFFSVLDELKGKVLKDALPLPMATPTFVLKPADENSAPSVHAEGNDGLRAEQKNLWYGRERA